MRLAPPAHCDRAQARERQRRERERAQEHDAGQERKEVAAEVPHRQLPARGEHRRSERQRRGPGGEQQSAVARAAQAPHRLDDAAEREERHPGLRSEEDPGDRGEQPKVGQQHRRAGALGGDRGREVRTRHGVEDEGDRRQNQEGEKEAGASPDPRRPRRRLEAQRYVFFRGQRST